jgi:hypothetical protein
MKNYLRFIIIAAVTVVFLIVCDNPDNSGDDNCVINSLSVDGSTGVRTTKLVFTINNGKFDLTANDIKINANFSVIKENLNKINNMTYELFLTPGRTGSIKIGLDPYRGFTGWNAKTVNVYAEWYFNGTSELTIIGSNKSDVLLQIPVEIAGVPVTSIGDYAFYSKNLIGVNILHNITAIGDSAFISNNLSEIDIPESVKTIGNNAFAYNQLSVAIIPENVTAIGSGAFAYNQLSYDNIIPEKIKIIENFTFAYNRFANIIIPDGVKEIRDNAFAYNRLPGVTIPGSVNYLSGFNNNELTDIIIPDGVNIIGSSAFAYNKLNKIVIPGSVKRIEFLAFYNNPLISITIGANVTINNSSFSNGFENVYNLENNKAAGTYTRTNISSNVWSKE